MYVNFTGHLRHLFAPWPGLQRAAGPQLTDRSSHLPHMGVTQSGAPSWKTRPHTPTKEVTEERPWVTQRSRSGQKRERRILDGSKYDCSCDGQISWPQTQTWLLIRARIYIYAFVCNICQRMPRPVDWTAPRPRPSTVHFCFSNANGATAKLI